MTGKRVVLDTNVVVSHFRNRGQHDRAFVEHELHLPLVVLAELFAGALKSQRPDHHRGLIECFLGSATVLVPDIATAKLYGQIWAGLASMGRMIPQNDIWIAATALQEGMTL